METIKYYKNDLYVFEFQVESIKLYESNFMRTLQLINERERVAGQGEVNDGDNQVQVLYDEGIASLEQMDAEFRTSKENLLFEMHNLVPDHNNYIDKPMEKKLADKYQTIEELGEAVDKALGDIEVLDYDDEDGEFDDDEYGEVTYPELKSDPAKIPIERLKEMLKVRIDIFGIDQFEVSETYFTDNINKMVAEREAPPLALSQLSTQPGPADLEELKKKSLSRLTTATRPQRLYKKLKKSPLYIKVYAVGESAEGQQAVEKLVGVSRLDVKQSFIDVILTGHTASMIPQAAVCNELLPVMNCLLEHVGDITILFRLSNFGRVPWHQCPPSIVNIYSNKDHCTVVKCTESDDSDMFDFDD